MQTKKKSIQKTPRNWAVVIVGSVLIIFGTIIAATAIMNISNFGWWSLPIGLGGLSSISMSVTAIAK